tara:strand:- start:49 stop:780 length:732 start_codon:yes stop_codon:yes gene_type:complete
VARLTKKKRDALPDSAFAIVDKNEYTGKVLRRAYPIPDIDHARNALARVASARSNHDKRRVYLAICKKYPELARRSKQMSGWRVRNAHLVAPELAKCAPRASNPDEQQWVLLGAAVETFEGSQATDLNRYLLVTDKSGDLQLVKVSGRGSGPKPSKKAARAWRARTLKKAARETTPATRPTRGPWRKVGAVEAIHYTGNLQGTIDDYRHIFSAPFPVLQVGPDGYRILRSGSTYSVTDRGIVG